jgi:hypothetical protein
MKTLLTLFVLCATMATSAAAISIGGRGIYAGGNTDITEAVAGNLYSAGGQVTVSAPVDGKARIAGGRVEIQPSATIAKGAVLAGGEVIVRGAVNGDLRAAGGHVTIDSRVAGDASVAAGTLDLGPNARIGGKLTFRGEHLERDPAAEVAGGVVRKARHDRSWEGRTLARSTTGAIFTLGLMLLAAIIAGALPGATRRMQDELHASPWLATLFGIVALICIPIAAVLVMITIIGIPLGLLALLGYVALVIVGYVSASVLVSGLLLDRYKPAAAASSAWRAGSAALAMLVISSLAHVPLIGGFVALVALVIGVGAIVTATLHGKARAPAAA